MLAATKYRNTLQRAIMALEENEEPKKFHSANLNPQKSPPDAIGKADIFFRVIKLFST